MRLCLKFLLMLGFVIGSVRLMNYFIDDLDEAVFVARVYAGRMTGHTDDEYYIAAAGRLLERQHARFFAARQTAQPAPGPLVIASASDSLQSWERAKSVESPDVN